MDTEPDWRRVREDFPTLRHKTYLNSCSVGLLSRRTRAALERFTDMWEEFGAASWHQGWMDEMQAVRAEFARLINADSEEVAILPNVSSCLASISSSLDFNRRRRVVTSALDFPTVPQHFLALGKKGVETAIVPSTDGVTVDLDRFEAAITDDTALVATSHVYFISGYIQDVASITARAHHNGALVLIDDYQATGQVPMDVRAVDVDILVSGGAKWLLGGYGIAYMFVKKELVTRLTPTVAGWFGSWDQFSFNPHEMVFRDDAGRFETGTPSVAAVYTGAAGLRQVNELGAQTIRQRTSAITAHLVARLRGEGFGLRVPQGADRHASITMVEMEKPDEAVRRLAERDIIVDARVGGVRISPYFYNSLDDVEAVVSALKEIRQSSRV